MNIHSGVLSQFILICGTSHILRCLFDNLFIGCFELSNSRGKFKMRFLVFILFCSFLVAQNPFLYQISTRAWLFELSEKYARPITKLKDIPIAEFQALKNQGVEVIWMMGLWKLGFYGLARSTDIELRNVCCL